MLSPPHQAWEEQASDHPWTAKCHHWMCPTWLLKYITFFLLYFKKIQIIILRISVKSINAVFSDQCNFLFILFYFSYKKWTISSVKSSSLIFFIQLASIVSVSDCLSLFVHMTSLCLKKQGDHDFDLWKKIPKTSKYILILKWAMFFITRALFSRHCYVFLRPRQAFWGWMWTGLNGDRGVSPWRGQVQLSIHHLQESAVCLPPATQVWQPEDFH